MTKAIFDLVKALDPILALLKDGPRSGADLARALGISRQAVHKRLRVLVLADLVYRRGITRAAVFATVHGRPGVKEDSNAVSRCYRLAGLQEDKVFDELSLDLQLGRMLPENVIKILRYAFTEMLNNAIDHSQSDKCHVTMTMDPYTCSFVVRDHGIGIFHSIASKLGLPDETRAVEELMKGKTTTMAERHSGEGVFFTTKIADFAVIRSHAFELTCDNVREDVILKSSRRTNGTQVQFRIARHSRRDLAALFRQYAPGDLDYRFEKTRVGVRLYQHDYVSRSEARRLLTGLDKFTIVELDFTAINGIGQGFADEIFRVFMETHPGIRFEIIHASDAIKAMIHHVVDKHNIEEVDNRLTIEKRGTL